MSKQFTHIKLEQIEPFKMDNEMDVNQFNLICGQNGVGKSFINKLHWVSASILSTFVNAQCAGSTMSDDELKTLAQYIFDKTFKSDNITGSYNYKIKDTLGLTTTELTFIVDSGKVISCTLTTDITEQMASPIYMSSATRTFKALELYVQFRNLLKIDMSDPALSQASFDKLCDSFPLYDVLAMEKTLKCVDNPDIVEKAIEAIKSFDDASGNLKDVKYIFKIDDVISVSGDTFTKKASELSDGEQSLLMMFLMVQ